jgi:hypothetical protein
MSESIRYITNDQGERVGVLLDLAAYQRIENALTLDTECLSGLSQEELQALANCKLSIAEQTRLDDLLTRNAESHLAPDETLELDHLLSEVDHLTILKARARYTLQRFDQIQEAS